MNTLVASRDGDMTVRARDAASRGRSVRACTSAAVATIRVHDLRLRTYVGFNPDERAKQQDVVINLEIAYRMADGVRDDRVEDALDYKTVTKAVIAHVEGGRFLLLEKLTADLLDLCSAHPAVEHARVRVEKPHALRFADSVSVTLEYRANGHPAHSERAQ